ncbi:hypothetical protein DCS_05506 [Drechmeria coniospora]|uniref:Uncharacterized protein n=1 Tax=Drechmeria coniospora TaxID=98403 RepID=A0A151GN21_DRECN|nr:hypothetical protein DCS_05506 [Drechmeria coniospora]KYK58490.1 hypothetical protein DCS_05506 [Drechmeria coniospora]
MCASLPTRTDDESDKKPPATTNQVANKGGEVRLLSRSLHSQAGPREQDKQREGMQILDEGGNAQKIEALGLGGTQDRHTLWIKDKGARGTMTIPRDVLVVDGFVHGVVGDVASWCRPRDSARLIALLLAPTGSPRASRGLSALRLSTSSIGPGAGRGSSVGVASLTAGE